MGKTEFKIPVAGRGARFRFKESSHFFLAGRGHAASGSDHANDTAGQYGSCDTRAGLSGAAAVTARQHQPSETAADVSAGRILDCQWVLKNAKSLAVTGTLGAGTAGRAAAGR